MCCDVLLGDSPYPEVLGHDNLDVHNPPLLKRPHDGPIAGCTAVGVGALQGKLYDSSSRTTHSSSSQWHENAQYVLQYSSIIQAAEEREEEDRPHENCQKQTTITMCTENGGEVAWVCRVRGSPPISVHKTKIASSAYYTAVSFYCRIEIISGGE